MSAPTLHSRSLHSITRGATLFIVGLAIANVFGFALTMILTRHLGPGGYGIYSYTLTVVGLILVVTTLGADTSILRYIPAYEDDSRTQEALLGIAYLTAIGCGIVIGIALFVGASMVNAYTLDEPIFTPILRLFGVVVITSSILRMITSTFRGLERLEYDILLSRIIRPALTLASVAVAVIVGASVYGVMASVVIASVLGALIAIVLLLTCMSIRPTLSPRALDRRQLRRYYNYSLPLTLNGAGQFFKNRVDILIVGLILSSAAVGLYNIALLFASALLIPLVAINQLFPPVAARLHARADRHQLNAVFSVVTRWAFTIALIIALIAVVFRSSLLAIFGVEFVAAGSVLVLLVGGTLITSASGPSTYLLMMTGHQYATLLNKVVFGLANIVLTYYFVLEFGLIGAGISTLMVLALYNIAELAQLWYFERLFPYSTAYFKPVIAGVAAFAVMVVAGIVWSGWILLVSGPVFGVVAYLTGLVVLGIDPADKQCVADMITGGSSGLLHGAIPPSD